MWNKNTLSDIIHNSNKTSGLMVLTWHMTRNKTFVCTLIKMISSIIFCLWKLLQKRKICHFEIVQFRSQTKSITMSKCLWISLWQQKRDFFFLFFNKDTFSICLDFFTHAAILSMKWNLLFFIGKNSGIQLFYWKLFSFIGTLFVNISFSLVKQFFVSTFDFKILYIQYRNRFHIINREQNYLCYITMPFNHHNTNSSLIT